MADVLDESLALVIKIALTLVKKGLMEKNKLDMLQENKDILKENMSIKDFEEFAKTEQEKGAAQATKNLIDKKTNQAEKIKNHKANEPMVVVSSSTYPNIENGDVLSVKEVDGKIKKENFADGEIKGNYYPNPQNKNQSYEVQIAPSEEKQLISEYIEKNIENEKNQVAENKEKAQESNIIEQSLEELFASSEVRDETKQVLPMSKENEMNKSLKEIFASSSEKAEIEFQQESSIAEEKTSFDGETKEENDSIEMLFAKSAAGEIDTKSEKEQGKDKEKTKEIEMER